MKSIRTLAAQVFTLAALLLLNEAYLWMVEGHGLNPFIAIPVALIFLILPYPVTVRT